MVNVFEYARSRFDHNCKPDRLGNYSHVADAWAIALGIDNSTEPATPTMDDEQDEDPMYRSCRMQRHGVRL